MSTKSTHMEYLPGTVLEELRGEKVVLRPFTWEDAARRAKWPAYGEVEHSNLNVDLTTEARRQEWYRQRARQRSPFWFAVDDFLGEMVGEETLRDVDPAGKSVRLGIHLSPMCLDRGYGTDAVRLVMRYVFEHMRYNELKLDVAAWNRRAIRCYERCGFEVRHHFWRYHGLACQVLSEERCAHLRPYVRLEGGLEVMKHWEMSVTAEKYRELKTAGTSGGTEAR